MKPRRTILDEFEELTAAVLDGTATPAERARFTEITRAYPEFRSVWLEQVRLHALLTCRGTRYTAAPLPRNRPAALKNSRGTRHAYGWRSAAAAAVLLTGAALWRDAWRASPPSALRPPSSVSRPLSPVSRPLSSVADSPVTVVAWKDAWGLELPQALPGQLRLAKGEIKVRLPSGVELVLLSPLEMDVENDMEVRLAKGRLVAWVPRRASGFTVHAPGLTAWDIGTVFSVAAEANASDLFVFKGSVQVLDGEGNGVDLCEAGEGVRALAGKTPFKVAAEGAAAERMLRAVRGYAALDDPQRAFRAARQVCEQWTAKYIPEEASRVREAAQRQAALRNAPKPIPFTKTAWVRPSVSRQEETSNMKTTSAATLAAAVILMGAETAGAVSEPVAINTAPDRNRRWSTVYTNEVPLIWEWHAGASRAQLDIVGMNGSVATNFASVTTNWLWTAFPSGVPSAEDAYTLTLTFFSGDVRVGALTSQVAVVTGAFGETSVIPTPEDIPWPKLKENVVIPYDAGWAATTAGATNSLLVIAKTGGLTQTNTLAYADGYFGWRVKRSDWGYGTFNLALTFPGTVTNAWDAALVRNADGMMIKVR